MIYIYIYIIINRDFINAIQTILNHPCFVDIYTTHLWQIWGWWILSHDHRQRIHANPLLYDLGDTVIAGLKAELGKIDKEHLGSDATNMGHFLRVNESTISPLL